MKNTKFYKTVLALTTYERKSLVKFFTSPYFNVNDRLTLLLGLAIEAISSGIEDHQKEDIWQKVHPDQKFSDVKYRKLFSDALKLIEQWLAQQSFESHPYYINTHLLNELSSRKMEALYNVALKQSDRIGKQQLEKSSMYHLYNFNKWKNKYNFTTEFSKKKTKSIEDLQSNIENLLSNLDIFYINEKLRYYCTILSWRRLTKYDTEIVLIDELIEVIHNYNLLEVTSIAVYYSVMMSMVEPDDESHYYNLKKHIQEDLDIFSRNEVRDIYDSAVSYCIAKVNSGVYKFTEEVLDIYKESLQSGTLFDNNKISPTTFRNIVFFACRAKDYAWSISFVEQYAELLDDRHRENAVNFSLARIYFYQEKYDETVYYLNQVDYEDPGYSLNSRAILISAYYELDEMEALESLLNTFKVYLTRAQSIPERKKRNYLNLVKYTGQLIRIYGYDKAKLLRLKEKISEDSLVSKPWLLEKIKARLDR